MNHRPYPSWERALNQLWRHHANEAAAVAVNRFVAFVFDAHPDLRELDAMLDNVYGMEDQ